MARKAQQRPAKPKIAIIGDGETEKIYFSDVKDTDRPEDIDLFPALPSKKGDYAKVLGSAIGLAEQYTRVFALVDKDTVIQDGHLKDYVTTKAAAEAKGVIVLEIGPCFEFWLLLHFVATIRSFTRCNEVVEAHAIAAGKKLTIGRPDDNPHFPRADVFEFFEWYIRPDRLKLLEEGKVWPKRLDFICLV